MGNLFNTFNNLLSRVSEFFVSNSEYKSSCISLDKILGELKNVNNNSVIFITSYD